MIMISSLVRMIATSSRVWAELMTSAEKVEATPSKAVMVMTKSPVVLVTTSSLVGFLEETATTQSAEATAAISF